MMTGMFMAIIFKGKIKSLKSKFTTNIDNIN